MLLIDDLGFKETNLEKFVYWLKITLPSRFHEKDNLGQVQVDTRDWSFLWLPLKEDQNNGY